MLVADAVNRDSIDKADGDVGVLSFADLTREVRR
jgi:hypothetical protein